MSTTRKTPARSRAFTARSTLSVLVAAATSPSRPKERPTPRAPMITNDERHRMIARLAYGYAERAGFGSDALSDWLTAEREVDSLLAKAS
jgi:hypothetical protein